jgi:hypothetical protein
MKRTGLIATCLFVICSLSGCGSTKGPSVDTAKGSEGSRYIRRQNADTVIVFVHGIFGGAVGTWTNSQSGVYWPQLLVDDPTFHNADVYVYSYAAPYVGHSYTIDELIENMRIILTNDEIFEKHKRVVFLCHSMGGIVVRGFLKRYVLNAPKVPLVYFFSTPTAGAHVTQLARFLSKNPQLGGMLPANSENYVSNLERDWRAMPYHVNSHCAYEIQDTYGIRIVDEQSAASLCDGPVDPIDANHIDIVKPKDRRGLQYIAFKEAYLSSSQSSLPPDSVKTGTVQTGRSIEVNCGQVRDATALIPPPIEIKPEQKVIDAIASLQEASNLKEQKVEMKGLLNQMAQVHYRLVGMDNPATGPCPAKGMAVVLVTFVLSQPPTMITTGFTPMEKDDVWLGLAARSGSFHIANPASIPSIDSQPAVGNALLYRADLYIKGVAKDGTEYRVPHSKLESPGQITPERYDRQTQKSVQPALQADKPN